MDALLFLKEYSDVIGLILAMLVLPIMHSMRNAHRRYTERDRSMIEGLKRCSNEIKDLRVDMLNAQHRHERMEDAMLFLASDKDMKKVIRILRGHDETQTS